jgi:hypothetical protein
VRLEEMQELWRSQPQAATPVLDGRALARAVGRYGRNETRIYTVKFVAVAAVAAVMALTLRSSGLALCGVALLALGALSMVAVEWRNQRGIARLSFAEPSTAFVESTIKRLMHQREAYRRQLWILMLFVGGGINVVYLTVLHTTPVWRLAIHLAGTVAVYVGYRAGWHVRVRRFERECRPLVNQLIAMRHALEERSL